MATTQLEAYNTISVLAGADLTASQFRFVKLSSGAVVRCGTGEAAIGVLLNAPASGAIASVQIGGVAKVSADAAVTVDDKIMSSTDGQGATRTGVNNSLGIAMTAAAAAGELFECKLEQSDGTPGGGVGSFENTAITPSVGLALLTVDGTDTANTLADGTIPGQEIEIICVAASNTPVGTLTINDAYGSEPTVYTFTTVGQGIKLKWTSTGWKLIKLSQIGTETVAADATANPLCLVHSVAVTNTVDFIQGSGLIAGQRSIWVAASNSGTPVGTVSGLFYTTAMAATGTDVNFNAASDSAVLCWVGARWYAETLVSATIS
jgi:hypothetical protein